MTFVFVLSMMLWGDNMDLSRIDRQYLEDAVQSYLSWLDGTAEALEADGVPTAETVRRCKSYFMHYLERALFESL